jgi:hypothetical protein
LASFLAARALRWFGYRSSRLNRQRLVLVSAVNSDAVRSDFIGFLFARKTPASFCPGQSAAWVRVGLVEEFRMIGH